MQKRRIGIHRCDRIKHRGQLLVLHVDEFQGLLDNVFIDGCYCGDLFADVAHAILR
jgi:hypothetical protein